jgi:hypothetical protein
MHDIEPHYNWLHLYNSEEDECSPFFEKEHSEFEYSQTVYNYLIHPQWDDFGSSTLYLKMLNVDYERGFCIIEFIGEWNDAINNDIMTLKRDVIEFLQDYKIDKFILIGENVLNFHSSDDSYYDEWYNELDEGWIALINFREHILTEFKEINADYFLNFGGELDDLQWRKYTPLQLFEKVEQLVSRRLSC